MNCQVVLTLWIIIGCVIKTAKQPKLCRLQGKNEHELAGSIAGCIMHGFGMIALLYFGGFYN